MKTWTDYGITGEVRYGQPAHALPYVRRLLKLERAALARLSELRQREAGQLAVFLSFGSDSLVAYDLAQRAGLNAPAVWVNQGPLAEWPDCLALKDLMLAQGLPLVEIAPDITLYDWYRQHGIPLNSNMNNAEDERLNRALLYDPIERWQRAVNLRGFVWGLRWRGEGRHRAFVICKHGELYTRKTDGLTVCSPVGNWSKREIWAYIDTHALAYPAFYDIDRERTRNGPPIGTSGLNMGRVVSLRQMFPSLWRVFCAEFPEIQRYG